MKFEIHEFGFWLGLGEGDSSLLTAGMIGQTVLFNKGSILLHLLEMPISGQEEESGRCGAKTFHT
jgi:hypothetical protein